MRFVSISDWKSHSSYHGFAGADDPVLKMSTSPSFRTHGSLQIYKTINRFWTVVQEFSPEQRSQLLHYVTSCSRPPLLGFAALQPGCVFPPFCLTRRHDPSGFQIQRMHIQGGAPANANDFLPMAATCMNILKLPPYTDIGCFIFLRLFASAVSCTVADTMRTKLVYAMNSNSGFFLA
jgi:ubiquitin-protein ligase E3 C